jgi:uncharacterized protein
MFERQLKSTLERLSQQFPVVAITGPRQSGKTTLARMMFADKAYVSLEDPAERAFAIEDPRGFLARFSAGAVFDEAQRWPDLFSYLQGIVDADRVPGRFVLTGSQQFGLLAGISQSLAGRVGMCNLAPLTFDEVPSDQAMTLSLDQWILKGGYPGLYSTPTQTQDWFASYVATYLERDVRQLTRVLDLGLFQKLLKLCAGHTGQLLNLSALAGDTGITQNTAKAWLSVLEASYIVHLLPPYHQNFGKRLVKSPKLYFLDTGLAAWLIGIRAAEQLALHPFRGALFETMVVGEAIKSRFNSGAPADLYFWRDNNGVEADLVFESARGLEAIEIKSGSTVTSDMVSAGKKSIRFANGTAQHPCVVYGGDESYVRSGVEMVGWRELGAKLRSSVKVSA